VQVNGKKVAGKMGRDGYLALEREWKEFDHIQLDFPLEPRVQVGDHKNEGKIAVWYGPLVLAADDALLGEDKSSLVSIDLDYRNER